MSNQNNRFLLPHQPTSTTTTSSASIKGDSGSPMALAAMSQDNEYQVDVDFDSYWEEEARNPNRNRIRIGRQYQATVTPLLKIGEKDERKLEDLETLTFCPKRSAKVTNAELDHYFTVAKSLNLFASLVETRSLLGRDVTIADLNRIRQKEGLSLASVIQPSRQSASNNNGPNNISPQSYHQAVNSVATSSSNSQQHSSPHKSPSSSMQDSINKLAFSSASILSPNESQAQENITLNQPLMKALSHFISLHHPCHHNTDCKKLLKDIPLEDESAPTVSITAGNLRGSPSKESKSFSRSRSKNVTRNEEFDKDTTTSEQKDQTSGDISSVHQRAPQQSQTTHDDWTREEVELFSKAIEVCGKNFGSIKKEFLPSKSVRSIVEYYYIGSRDVSESKKKSGQNMETVDGCSSPEKTQTNNNDQGGGSGSGGGDSLQPSGKNAPSSNIVNIHSATATGRSSAPSNSSNSSNNGKTISDAIDSEKLVTTHVHNNSSSRPCDNYSKQSGGKTEINTNITKSKSKNIDARMSVYNFDDEIKEEASPVRFECPRPGAEVRPLKAKPIMPNNPGDSEAGNSNVGSLKFFMDGQLVLKLNVCQEQQEGNEKCHWVQSGDKLPIPSKQKRYTKRSSNNRTASDLSQNGSQSNSVVSSNHDDDSKNEDLMSADEDSKESASSVTNYMTTPRPRSFPASPSPRRARSRTEASISPNQTLSQHLPLPHLQQHQQLLTSPVDYNRLAVNNRMKERNDNNHSNLTNPLVSQAAAMPWLQANSFAMAAALLGGLPFPPAAGPIVDGQLPNNAPNSMNLATKPMDLSVEHNPPKPISAQKPSRSRNKHKN